MLVTIFTDASHDHHLQVGGWGAWFKSERRTSHAWDAFKLPCRTAYVAEFGALVAGIHHALLSGVAQQGDQLLLQTDCLAIIKALEHRGRLPKCELGVATRRHYDKLLHAFDLSIKFRHVPGHTGTGQPRLWCNDFTDRLAKRGLAKAREQARRGKSA